MVTFEQRFNLLVQCVAIGVQIALQFHARLRHAEVRRAARSALMPSAKKTHISVSFSLCVSN